MRKSILAFLVVAEMLAGFSGETAGGSAKPLSLSEVVLFGVGSVNDLAPENYPPERRHCLQKYLQAVPADSVLRLQKLPAVPEGVVNSRRKNLIEQVVILLGRMAAPGGEQFAAAVPLSMEWEGMSEGPLNEADLARQWLAKYPATPLRPFLHLFMAHRLRAGYEAARRENAKGLWPVLAERYKKELALALESNNTLIVCLAEDLEAQPYVYLAGFGRP